MPTQKQRRKKALGIGGGVVLLCTGAGMLLTAVGLPETAQIWAVAAQGVAAFLLCVLGVRMISRSLRENPVPKF